MNQKYFISWKWSRSSVDSAFLCFEFSSVFPWALVLAVIFRSYAITRSLPQQTPRRSRILQLGSPHTRGAAKGDRQNRCGIEQDRQILVPQGKPCCMVKPRHTPLFFGSSPGGTSKIQETDQPRLIATVFHAGVCGCAQIRTRFNSQGGIDYSWGQSRGFQQFY